MRAAVLVVLPPVSASLSPELLALGAQPVVDCTGGAPAELPSGAGVRVNPGQEPLGDGPVVFTGPAAPVAGRACWLETSQALPVPEGFEGVVLRGTESGGLIGDRSVLALLSEHPEPSRCAIDGVSSLRMAAQARAAGARVQVAGLVAGLMDLPAPFAKRIHADRDLATLVVNGFRLAAAPTAPVVRSLAGGADPASLTDGLWQATPDSHAWPIDAGLAGAAELMQWTTGWAPVIEALASGLTELQSDSVAPVSVAPASPPSAQAVPAVAIIGMGCRLPDAPDIDAFWANIVNAHSSITLVPDDRWSAERHWDPDHSVPDKTYSRIGAFLNDYQFDSKRFRIPPRVAKQIDPVQQITLSAVADALLDADLRVDKRSGGREFNRDRCAVILGNSLGGELKDAYAVRLAWADIAAELRPQLPAETADTLLSALRKTYMQGLPEIDEDSMPGELSNVITGRVANAFDLGGANFTVDAACASSMAAVQSAVSGLQRHDFDVAVTGGADRSMNVTTYVKFSKIGALSPDHSAPFDASANGFVMGEGCGILVLKRYEDAIADGDKIYAVIKGIGASSDGKGKGITAPNPIGQERALERAYANAGIEPWDVDLIEAHGTSTSVGDRVEVASLAKVIGPGHRATRGPIRLGSVKSNIGHLKSAAGAAAIIKTALALHHGVFPPSVGFKNKRDDVPLDVVPLQVQTKAEPWPLPPSGLRRAGVSAFGFGGTNFHVVMESFANQQLPANIQAAPPVPQPAAPPAPVPSSGAALLPRFGGSMTPPSPPPERSPTPDGIWCTSADDTDQLLVHVRRLRAGQAAPWDPSAAVRIAAAFNDDADREAQLDRVISTLSKGKNPDMLRARSIFLEQGPVDGSVAFLFTGQGSQYLDMGLDLAEHYPIVAATFAEADATLTDELGISVTELIRFDKNGDKEAQDLRLRATQHSQPATLTLDIAILRLLTAYGVSPDLVAGHSLGEYAAAVAAGVMTFPEALYAVSARGREMANIQIDDPGRMAGIAASTEVVEEVLADIGGYVVAANKNCPTQTVIAGASDAVEEAMERFRARNLTVHPLPVSHAFHSRIVAPASEPLRSVLNRFDLKPPRRPITTNVSADYYPLDKDGVVEILAQQIFSPVEWIAQTERMYADGARVFVEIGPKRALAGFTLSILKRRPHRALWTNHPKHGGLRSFRDALAGLLAAGMPVRSEPTEGIPDLFVAREPRTATTEAVNARLSLRETEATPDIAHGVLAIVAKHTGYEQAELSLTDELEADLGIDTVKQAEIFSVVRRTWGIAQDPDFRFADHRTLGSLVNWAAERTGATRPQASSHPQLPAPAQPIADLGASEQAMSAFVEAAARSGLSGASATDFTDAVLPAVRQLLEIAMTAANAGRPSAPAPAPVAAPPAPARPAPAPALRKAPHSERISVVCSGASVGLPGGDSPFAPAALAELLHGANRIDHIGERAERFLDMNLVRLVKDPKTGDGTFLPVETLDQVIRLAGLNAGHDLSEWGVDERLSRALDITTQLAIAAGLEALRDAGIPLVRTFRTSTTGKRVPEGWRLPEPLQDGTGVIFASAFPGYDQLLRKVTSGGDDGEGRFDRRLLFQILSMGHSQFAQFIGARGPNTAINAACASTTQAVALAEDWLRLGRAERVVIIAADDASSEQLLPWIGGGFMAAGAATTKDVVAEAALPFDARRHGMIIGMGAVGLVLERGTDVTARGVHAIAELAGSFMGNSAFHGTRLDSDHISRSMVKVVQQAAARLGTTANAIADSAMFMSHETYTPARGGSAAAEIAALRAAFGAKARNITVCNTKGFTGHAMGAGIEDAVALKALQYGILPPIPNLKERDPDLGDLTLSDGAKKPTDWGIRLAAGFGSQLAITVWKRIASGDDRVFDSAARAGWLHALTGERAVRELLEHRTLRVEAAETDELRPICPDVSPATWATGSEPAKASSTKAPPRPQTGTSSGPGAAEMLTELIALVANKTGYDPAELEPDFELEADLGIDTVKQAEIFSEIRDRYGMATDENFKLSDHPTIAGLARYLSSQLDGGTEPSAPTPVAEPAEAAPMSAKPADAPTQPAAAAPSGPIASLLPELIALVAEKTGYDPSELEPEFELEADLGIDTVKQAEIFSELRERHGMDRDDDFRLSDFPTIEALAGYLTAQLAKQGAGSPTAVAVAASPSAAAAPPSHETTAEQPPATPAQPAATPSAAVDSTAVLADLIALVAQKTGYEPSELDPEYELEADLGIDTVKQAEIFSELRERYRIAQDDSFSLADAPTIEALAAYLAGRASNEVLSKPAETATKEVVTESEPAEEVSDGNTVEDDGPTVATSAPLDDELVFESDVVNDKAGAPAPPPSPSESNAMLDELTQLVSAKTGYALDELEPDYELEADLGIDTVKQAEIFSELRERHSLPRDETFTLADAPTLEALASYLSGLKASAGVTAGLSPGDVPEPADEDVGDTPSLLRRASRSGQLVAGTSSADGPDSGDDTPNGSYDAPVDLDNQVEDDDFDPATVTRPEIVALVQAHAAKISGLSAGDLDPSLEIEADLGIDVPSQQHLLRSLAAQLAAPVLLSIETHGGLTIHTLAKLVTKHLLEGSDALPNMPVEAGADTLIAGRDGLMTPEEYELHELPEPQSPPFDFDHDRGDREPPEPEDEPPALPDVVTAPRFAVQHSTIAVIDVPEPVGLDPAAAPDVDDEEMSYLDIDLDPALLQPPDLLDSRPPLPAEDIGSEVEPQDTLVPSLAVNNEASDESPIDDTPAPRPPAPPVDRVAAEGEQRVGPFVGAIPVGDPDEELDTKSWKRRRKSSPQPIEAATGMTRPADLGPLPTRGEAQPAPPSDPHAFGDTVDLLPPDELGADPATSEEDIAGSFEWPSAFDDSPPTFDSPPLPEPFRVRRLILVPQPLPQPVMVTGRRILVLGDTPLARQMRSELTERGAELVLTQPEAVVDCCDSVLESLEAARTMLAQRPERWLTVTRLGGTPALDAAMDDGARAGFTKALGREWQATTGVRVVDVDPVDGLEHVAQVATDELMAEGAEEVFHRGDIRAIVLYETVPAPAPGMLADNPVVVLTGGARGITARVAEELAIRGPVRLALIGRGPAGEVPLDLGVEKERIKQDLLEAGDRVTPVMVRDRLAPLQRAEEVRATVERLAGLGAEVRYFRCDLAVDSDIGRMLNEVRNHFGGLDVVIHGAGVEQSRLIEDKQAADFKRVFDGKARGARAMLSRLPPEVVFVSMGSVAGRFGNAGQVDYSAANDAVARMCLSRRGALHVDWTAWGDVGMAVRGGMQALLEDRGIDLLPAPAGAALLVDLMAAGITGEVVVAGRLGDFWPHPAHPLLDRVEWVGDRVRAYRELSVDSDGWIVDHAIEDTPVLPGVIGLELMAAVGRLVDPTLQVMGAENVRFDKPVKLHKGEGITLRIDAQKDPESGDVTCVLSSVRTLRTGRVQETAHFTCTLLLGASPLVPGLPSAFFPDEAIPAVAVYRRFFHGRRFQVMRQIWGVAGDGLLAEARTDDDGIAPGLATGPLALEAAFQAAGLHRMITSHQMALPMSVDCVRWLRRPEPGDSVDLMVHKRDDAYDVDVDGSNGTVLRLRGFRLIDTGPLKDSERFSEPAGGRPFCLTPPEEATAPEDTATPDKGSDAPADLAMARGKWDDDVDRWMDNAELAEVCARGTEKRIRDRIAGRIAAKRAIKALVGVEPLDVSITTAESGEPQATVPGHPDLRVSISHREGRAVAAAVRTGRVGIDLEGIAPRPEGFGNDWFQQEETARFSADLVQMTVAWAAKEAVLKALSSGMAIHPRDVEVTAISDDVVEVQLHAAAAEALAEIAQGPPRLTWTRENAEEVVVTARIGA